MLLVSVLLPKDSYYLEVLRLVVVLVEVLCQSIFLVGLERIVLLLLGNKKTK